MPSFSGLYLTKSGFLDFKTCPASFWVSMHEPEENAPLDEVAEDTIQQGFEVEDLARDLFPGVVEIGALSREAAHEITLEEMAREDKRPLTQATLITDSGCLVKADFIQWDEAQQAWDIYEVKATTEVDAKHITDLAFQRFVFTGAGVPVGRTHLVHLRKKQVKQGDLIATVMLETEDVTDQVDAVLAPSSPFYTEVAQALALVRASPAQGGTRPAGCACWLKSKGNRCEHFALLNPAIPKFSAFDVRVHHKKAEPFYGELHRAGLYSVDDVPEDLMPLAGSKQALITLVQNRATLIDRDKIRAALDGLAYPLYYLDYETAKWALPRYDGTWPYQQIPFQYSLHVQTAPTSDPECELLHYEFLQTDQRFPIPALVETMANLIGPVGSVIVWNKSFEVTRNKEMMGFVTPELAAFLTSVNERVYDLMEIFQKGYYSDYRFQGSYSIKKVLPVLVPDLTYATLPIQNGGEAMTRWPKAIFEPMPQVKREAIFAGLLEYCKLDTYAMVAILHELERLVAQ